MKRTFELLVDGEHAGTFDLFEQAQREALCVNKPWQIFACTHGPDHASHVIALGDGSWKCTHHVLIPRSIVAGDKTGIGVVRMSVYVTPDGFCFTEGAWNRGDVPDFRNTGAGVARGHGGPVLPGAQIIAKDN